MAIITAVDWESALGISGVATPYSTADAKPLFEPDQEIYLLSDFPTNGSNQNVAKIAYTVNLIELKIGATGGVMKVLDQSLDATTSAEADAGGTTRTVTGFDHQLVPAATVTATTWSNPYFYTVKRSSDNTVFYGIHQSQLNTLANIETYIAAEVANWWV